MTKLKVKKGDKVVVLTGKDKGKPTSANAGGLDKVEAPIHVSNVALVDPKTSKATRVGYKMVGDSKVRVARRSGEVID